jgi:hypothetical protein
VKSVQGLSDEAVRHVAGAFRERYRDRLSGGSLSPTAASEIARRDVRARARAILRNGVELERVDTALSYTQEAPTMSDGQRRRAGEIVQAFLNGEEVAVDPSITIAIATAAATAAVVVVVASVRRGHIKQGMMPSQDVLVLRRIAESGTEAALAAKALQRMITDPEVWALSEALPALRSPAGRPLLAALAREGALVEAASVGQRFDARAMVDRTSIGAGSNGDWLVGEVVEQGFLLADRTPITQAAVICETADWRVLSGHGHPVSTYILAHGRGFISDDQSYRRAWRAEQGFLDAQRLRERFDEATLQDWARSLAAAFAGTLQGANSGVPHQVGVPGKRFQALQMISAGDEVLGDADVVAVIERGGVPQFGLAVERGLALLPAVVEVRARA